MKGRIKQIFFVTECTPKSGMGHLSRCISLSDAFKEKGCETKFIVFTYGTGSFSINDNNYQHLDWINDHEKLFNIVPEEAVVIIDTYLAKGSVLETIAKHFKYPVFIADVKKAFFPKGIVLIGNAFAQELDLPTSGAVKYLLGKEYILLRKAFWDINNKKINEKAQSVLISLGGGANAQYLNKIIENIHEKFSHLEKTVVGNNIQSFNQKKVKCLENISPAEMVKLMLEHDMIICNGGQTLIEAIRTGLPAITVQIVDNQKKNIETWQKNQYIKNAGSIDDKKILENVNKCLDELLDHHTRIKLHDAVNGVIDGQGARRAVNRISEIYKVMS